MVLEMLRSSVPPPPRDALLSGINRRNRNTTVAESNTRSGQTVEDAVGEGQ